MRRPLVLLALTIAALSAAAAPAAAEPLACGDVVTHDVTLENDLSDCGVNGLVVGAPGITIDLNGHTIAGRFAGYDCRVNCLGQNGVDNSGGYDRIVMRDGTISSFDHAVHLAGTSRALLDGLTIVAGGPFGYTRVGVFMSGSHENAVRNTSVAGGGPAILLSGSDRNRIGDNTVSGDVGQHAGDGVQLIDGSDRNLLIRNDVEANGIAFVVRASNRNLVAANTLDTGLATPVLSMTGANRNEIRANTIATDGPGWGIRLSGNRNLIGENTVAEAYSGGIEVAGARNRIRANTLDRIGLQGDGIAVIAGARASLVERNLVAGAADDGIDVDAPGTLIGQNSATGNGDLGIEAVAGVTDLGGNTASGNGNPLQCQNVFCR